MGLALAESSYIHSVSDWLWVLYPSVTSLIDRLPHARNHLSPVRYSNPLFSCLSFSTQSVIRPRRYFKKILGRNGVPSPSISLIVSFPQQNVSCHSPLPFHHYHSTCFSGWRKHVQSPGPWPPLPCHGQGNGRTKREDRSLRPKWSIWRISSIWRQSEDSYLSISSGLCSTRRREAGGKRYSHR